MNSKVFSHLLWFVVENKSQFNTNRPVYQCTSNPDVNLFRCKNGLWVVTTGNSITENDSDGTLANTLAPSIVPYGVDWN